MKTFFIESPEIGSESSLVLRAADALRAANLYLGALEADVISMSDDQEAAETVSVMEIPSREGKVANFGPLERISFDRGKLTAETPELLDEDFPAEETNVLLVRVEDMNGEDWNYLIEAGSAGAAKDVALSLGEVENGVDRVIVQRLPEVAGPEGVVTWDDPLEMSAEFDPQP